MTCLFPKDDILLRIDERTIRGSDLEAMSLWRYVLTLGGLIAFGCALGWGILWLV